MGVLKRQVRNLTEHQQKLSAELTQIEDKYIQKKRKFLESSDAFNAELKKHCSKVVDEKKYKEMVAEQVDKLRSEREERARAGAPTPPPPTPPPTDPADQRPVLQVNGSKGVQGDYFLATDQDLGILLIICVSNFV